jgi:hypothetical protein
MDGIEVHVTVGILSSGGNAPLRPTFEVAYEQLVVGGDDHGSRVRLDD